MSKSPWHRSDPSYNGRQPTYKPPPSTSWWIQAPGEPVSEWRARVQRESVSRFALTSGAVYQKDYE